MLFEHSKCDSFNSKGYLKARRFALECHGQQKPTFQQVKWSFEQVMVVSVMDMFCIRPWTSEMPFSKTETHVWTGEITISTIDTYYS